MRETTRHGRARALRVHAMAAFAAVSLMGAMPAGPGTAVASPTSFGAVTGGGMTSDVRHISVSINRKPADVYEFASDPRNLPRWAAGLARSEVRKEGGEWVADSPMGKVRIRFAEKNPYGVLDHDVNLESGVSVHNPMRVVPNGEGSEFTFTLIRQPGMSDAKFAEDKAAVERDLRTLKELLERDTIR